MAADGYIKAAHGQLTSAVTQLQSEITQLQHQLSQQKGNLQSDIKTIDTKRTVHRMEVAQQNQDDTQRNYLQHRLETLGNERSEKEAALARMDAEIHNQIQAKQQAVGSLQNAANQVNSMLTLAGVR